MRKLGGNIYDEAVLQSLRMAFFEDHKDKLNVEFGYAGIWSFGAYMILPTFSPKLTRMLKVR